MRKRASLTALVYAALLSCGHVDADTATSRSRTAAQLAPARAVEPGAPPDARIVVVTIDGARWQEIFGGTDPALSQKSGLGPAEAATAEELVPHLRALARRGVAIGESADASFEASGPNFVSLPGYTEILTGRPAPCQENDCEARPRATLADEVRRLPGVSRREVAVLSSWERIDAIAAAEPDEVVVSAGRTHGATREVLAEDRDTAELVRSSERSAPWPGHDDYRPDRDTTAIALSYFEHARPRLLFVSLGDTDEHAHAGNYRGYLDALRRADAFVGDLMRVARGWGPEGERVVFFVTADHGRSAGFRDHGRDYPESARTWLVAGGGPIERGRFVGADGEIHGHLRDIAPTIRDILGIRADRDERSGVVLSELFEGGRARLALAP